jgi:transcription-repair coupling factor (superfamily II helicase)
VHTRLTLYKRMAEAADADALAELQVEMVDRFGSLPPSALNLVEVTRLRIAACALGVTKLRAGARGITLDFAAAPRLDPRRLIKLIQSQPKTYRLEGQKRLQFLEPLEAPESRAAAAQRLLATLAGEPMAGEPMAGTPTEDVKT